MGSGVVSDGELALGRKGFSPAARRGPWAYWSRACAEQCATREPKGAGARELAPKPAVVILAGGLSTRMNRDKSTLPWGQVTLLEHVRQMACETGWPVRVIRHDSVPTCGPLGGIYTAFRRYRASSILFLACDMPFLTPQLLVRIWRACRASQRAVFTTQSGRAGFPFVLRRAELAVVERRMRGRERSLQTLAAAVGAKLVSLPHSQAWRLANLNTPEDWAQARARRPAKRVR